MRLQRVDSHEQHARDQQSLHRRSQSRLLPRRGDHQTPCKRVDQQSWDGRHKVVVPRRGAPFAGVTLNGVEVEAPKFRPERFLPEVGVKGDGHDEGDDDGNDEVRDNSLQGGRRDDEEEVEDGGEEKERNFGAEDDAGHDEEGDGRAVAAVDAFRRLRVWEEKGGRGRGWPMSVSSVIKLKEGTYSDRKQTYSATSSTRKR